MRPSNVVVKYAVFENNFKANDSPVKANFHGPVGMNSSTFYWGGSFTDNVLMKKGEFHG